MSFEFLKSDTFVIWQGGDHLLESKRNEARQRVLLKARLHTVEKQDDVQVTDLSRSGLRGKSEISLTVGQSVFISLDDITHCSGTVRWIHGLRFGLKFDNLLEVLPTSSPADIGNIPDHQERMPRITSNIKATIRLSSWSCRAKIRNVSKSGMMLETELPLTTNQQLLVNLSDGRILVADVRWIEGDRVGIQLSSPVSILQLTYGDLQ